MYLYPDLFAEVLDSDDSYVWKPVTPPVCSLSG